MNQEVTLVIKILYVFVVKCSRSHQLSHGFSAKLVKGGIMEHVLLVKAVTDLSVTLACRLSLLLKLT